MTENKEREYHARINVKSKDNLDFWHGFQKTLLKQGVSVKDWLLDSAREYLAKNAKKLSEQEFLTAKEIPAYALKHHRMEFSEADLKYALRSRKLRPKFDFLVEVKGKKKKFRYKRVKIDRLLQRVKDAREKRELDKAAKELTGDAEYATSAQSVVHVEEKRVAPERRVMPMIVYREDD